MLTALAACRIHFDALGDDAAAAGDDVAIDVDTVLGGHDEDGDGIPDSLDVCPHVADSPQTDGDGDRVGDACDPNPATPTEEIVVFDPFVTLSSEWNLLGPAPMTDGESLIADTRGSDLDLRRPYTLGTDVFELAGELGAPGGGSEQIFITMLEPGQRWYYCELFDGGTPKLALSYTLDMASFLQIDETPLQGPLANGAFVLRMTHTPPTTSCTTSWPATGSEVGGTLPGGITPTELQLFTKEVEVRWHYFIHIRTSS